MVGSQLELEKTILNLTNLKSLKNYNRKHSQGGKHGYEKTD